MVILFHLFTGLNLVVQSIHNQVTHRKPIITLIIYYVFVRTHLGFQILNNGSLRIHHLQVQHTGYYLCWAENLVRRAHAQIRLEVQGIDVFFFRKTTLMIYQLVPPSIDQIERHYTGIIGQSVKLSCQANGIPIPIITWHGIYNASGTAIVDSFGNLYIDQLEYVVTKGEKCRKKSGFFLFFLYN